MQQLLWFWPSFPFRLWRKVNIYTWKYALIVAARVLPSDAPDVQQYRNCDNMTISASYAPCHLNNKIMDCRNSDLIDVPCQWTVPRLFQRQILKMCGQFEFITFSYCHQLPFILSLCSVNCFFYTVCSMGTAVASWFTLTNTRCSLSFWTWNWPFIHDWTGIWATTKSQMFHRAASPDSNISQKWISATTKSQFYIEIVSRIFPVSSFCKHAPKR